MDGNSSQNYAMAIARGDSSSWRLNNCGYPYAYGPGDACIQFDTMEAAEAFVRNQNGRFVVSEDEFSAFNLNAMADKSSFDDSEV